MRTSRKGDLIVCNGVFGWGLDQRDDCERAFMACFTRLKPGGHFMLRWNDVPAHSPLPLASRQGLARFTPQALPVLGTAHLLVDAQTRHVFDFYVKNSS